MRHEDADNALADALWWLRGFAAAQPAEDEVRRTLNDLADKLRNTRGWLNGLARGEYRRVGTSDDDRGVAVSEAEFERLFDGLRENSGDVDRAYGREVASKILAEFQHECRAARKSEAPF